MEDWNARVGKYTNRWLEYMVGHGEEILKRNGTKMAGIQPIKWLNNGKYFLETENKRQVFGYSGKKECQKHRIKQGTSPIL